MYLYTMGKPTRLSNGGISAAEDPRISVQMQVLRELKRLEEETPISPRSMRWVNDLFPLLETYNFSSVEIVSLVKRCEYNSEQIQIAVSGILEQALGHEQGEWTQVKNRKQKKEEQIAKDRVRETQDRNQRHIPGYGGASGSRDAKRRNRGGGRGGSRGGRGGLNGSRSSSNGINRPRTSYPPASSVPPNIPEQEEASADDVENVNEWPQDSNRGHSAEHDAKPSSASNESAADATSSPQQADDKRYSHQTPNRPPLGPIVVSCAQNQPTRDSRGGGGEAPPYSDSRQLEVGAQSPSNKSWAARLVASRTAPHRAVAAQPKPKVAPVEKPKSTDSPSSPDESEPTNVTQTQITPPSSKPQAEPVKPSSPEQKPLVNAPAAEKAEAEPVSLPEKITTTAPAAVAAPPLVAVKRPEPEEPVVMPRYHAVDEVSRKGLMFGTVDLDGDTAAVDGSLPDATEDVANTAAVSGIKVPPVSFPSQSNANMTIPAASKGQSVQDCRTGGASAATAERPAVNQPCQAESPPCNVSCVAGTSMPAARNLNRNNAPNQSVKYVAQKPQPATGVDMACSVNDSTVAEPRAPAYPGQQEGQQVPIECVNQQQEPAVDTAGAFHSKQQLLNTSSSRPPSTSANACVQTYVPTPQQQRKGSEAGGGSQAMDSRGGAPINNYSRGVAAQGYSGQSTTVPQSGGRTGGMNNGNANFPSQRPYSGNLVPQDQQQPPQQPPHHPPQSQSPYQHPRSTPPVHEKTHPSHSSSWYDQQQQTQPQQPSRANQTSAESSSNAQFSRNVGAGPSAHQQPAAPAGTPASGSQQTGSYSRPPPPLPTVDAQSQTLHQQQPASKNASTSGKSGQCATTTPGQQQQGLHQQHGAVTHMPQQQQQQQQQHTTNVYGAHPYSSAPPGLTPSGAPTGMHAQAAFNYGYPNMGYPPYNLPAYSGGYGQPMIPQYGMMGAPFNDKGGPGMHGGYPNQYGMGYADTFEDPSSIPYGSNNNGSPNEVMGYDSLSSNQNFHGSAQQNTQGASSTTGASSATSNSGSHAQGGGGSQMQNFNSNTSPSTNTGGGNSNYGGTGMYGQSYNNTSANGTGFSSTGQNAPPGFGSGGYSQKDGRSSGSVGGLGNNSSVPNNSSGYFPNSSNQSTSNTSNVGQGTSGGGSRSNNNSANNSNTWDNHCSTQNPTQNQYSSSNNGGNQGGGTGGATGYGNVPYSNRGGKSNNYSYSSNTGVSGQYANGNYGSRSSVGGNGQNNDGSQGYYSYGGYNQHSSNMQGQYSSQNPPGLGNYYTGQQFQQHSGGHYNNRNGQSGYGGYNNPSMWNNS